MSMAALQMGKYGVYVWSSYGLTVASLLYLVFAVRRQWQSELQQAQRRLKMAAQQNAVHSGEQS
ncbi:MAG: heme exporter protein CcmD [Steroidobacteraceae bacterium]